MLKILLITLVTLINKDYESSESGKRDTDKTDQLHARGPCSANVIELISCHLALTTERRWCGIDTLGHGLVHIWRQRVLFRNGQGLCLNFAISYIPAGPFLSLFLENPAPNGE